MARERKRVFELLRWLEKGRASPQLRFPFQRCPSLVQVDKTNQLRRPGDPWPRGSYRLKQSGSHMLETRKPGGLGSTLQNRPPESGEQGGRSRLEA